MKLWYNKSTTLFLLLYYIYSIIFLIFNFEYSFFEYSYFAYFYHTKVMLCKNAGFIYWNTLAMIDNTL